MRARNIFVALAATALMAGGAMPAANAIDELKSKQGDDYSINGSDGRSISACDIERDGNSVYVNFSLTTYSGWYGQKRDDNGSSAGCGDRFGTWKVDSHQVVEDAPGFNYYGNTVYPR